MIFWSSGNFVQWFLTSDRQTAMHKSPPRISTAVLKNKHKVVFIFTDQRTTAEWDIMVDLRILTHSFYKSSVTWEARRSLSAASPQNTCRVTTVLKTWHSPSLSRNQSSRLCWDSAPGHQRGRLILSGRFLLNTVPLIWVTKNYSNRTCLSCWRKYKKLLNETGRPPRPQSFSTIFENATHK